MELRHRRRSGRPVVRPLFPAAMAAAVAAAAAGIAAGCGGGLDHRAIPATPGPYPSVPPPPSPSPGASPTPTPSPTPLLAPFFLTLSNFTADANANPSPPQSVTYFYDSKIVYVQKVPTELLVTATHFTDDSGDFYTFVVHIVDEAGLRAGAVYTVGDSGPATASLSYRESHPNLDVRSWSSPANSASGSITIDSLQNDVVALHGTSRMTANGLPALSRGEFTASFSASTPLSHENH